MKFSSHQECSEVCSVTKPECLTQNNPLNFAYHTVRSSQKNACISSRTQWNLLGQTALWEHPSFRTTVTPLLSLFKVNEFPHQSAPLFNTVILFMLVLHLGFYCVTYVTERIVCPGPWPFDLFFPVILSLFWSGGNFMAPTIWSVKTCVLGRQHPFSPSVPAEAGCLFAAATCVHLRGEPTLFPGWCK